MIPPGFVSCSDSRKGKEVFAAGRDPSFSEREKGQGKARAGCYVGLPVGPREGEVGPSAGGGARGLGGPKGHHISLLLSFFFFFKSFFQGSF